MRLKLSAESKAMIIESRVFNKFVDYIEELDKLLPEFGINFKELYELISKNDSEYYSAEGRFFHKEFVLSFCDYKEDEAKKRALEEKVLLLHTNIHIDEIIKNPEYLEILVNEYFKCDSDLVREKYDMLNGKLHEFFSETEFFNTQSYIEMLHNSNDEAITRWLTFWNKTLGEDFSTSKLYEKIIDNLCMCIASPINDICISRITQCMDLSILRVPELLSPKKRQKIFYEQQKPALIIREKPPAVIYSTEEYAFKIDVHFNSREIKKRKQQPGFILSDNELYFFVNENAPGLVTGISAEKKSILRKLGEISSLSFDNFQILSSCFPAEIRYSLCTLKKYAFKIEPDLNLQKKKEIERQIQTKYLKQQPVFILNDMNLHFFDEHAREFVTKIPVENKPIIMQLRETSDVSFTTLQLLFGCFSDVIPECVITEIKSPLCEYLKKIDSENIKITKNENIPLYQLFHQRVLLKGSLPDVNTLREYDCSVYIWTSNNSLIYFNKWKDSFLKYNLLDVQIELLEKRFSSQETMVKLSDKDHDYIIVDVLGGKDPDAPVELPNVEVSHKKVNVIPNDRAVLPTKRKSWSVKDDTVAKNFGGHATPDVPADRVVRSKSGEKFKHFLPPVLWHRTDDSSHVVNSKKSVSPRSETKKTDVVRSDPPSSGAILSSPRIETNITIQEPQSVKRSRLSSPKEPRSKSSSPVSQLVSSDPDKNSDLLKNNKKSSQSSEEKLKRRISRMALSESDAGKSAHMKKSSPEHSKLRLPLLHFTGTKDVKQELNHQVEEPKPTTSPRKEGKSPKPSPRSAEPVIVPRTRKKSGPEKSSITDVSMFADPGPKTTVNNTLEPHNTLSTGK